MDIKSEKLEKMKTDIKKKTASILGVIAIANCAMILSRRDFMTKLYAHPEQADFMQGFITGIAMVITFVSIYLMIRNSVALTDEKMLTRLFNKLNDERELEICGNAGRFTSKAAPIVLILLALIVSLFSFEAGLGLIGAVFIVCVINKASHAYYNKNYTGRDVE